MNKTLKTVLITLAVTFVFLFAAVMIFGEDTSTPVDSSSQRSEIIPADASMNAEESTSLELAEAPSQKESKQASPTAEVSKETFTKTVGYDIFDWNGADEQGKIKIAKNIISVWAANGNSYEHTAKDLMTYINQNLSDQANIFEIACIAAQIDPQPYFERIN